MPRLLKFLVVITLTLVISGCGGFRWFKDTNRPSLPLAPYSNPTITVKSEPEPLQACGVDIVDQYRPHFFAIVALLDFWFLYIHRRYLFPGKKKLKLDGDDMALLGLATDTLSDLRHRLQAKSKNKIIKLPQRC